MKIIFKENDGLKTEEITRDDIIKIFKTYESMIIEADEWRPMADHILKLMEFAYFSGAFNMREKASQACSPILRSMISRSEIADIVLNIPIDLGDE